MTLYFITGNNHKFAEAKLLLPHIEQLVIDIPEIQSLDSKEIISHKLQVACSTFSDRQFFVEDTSLVFDAWHGLPGPLIKRFLHSVQDTGIWQMAKDFPDKRAYASCHIGYFDGQTTTFFEGICEGTIVEPIISSHFGWDALFQPVGYTKSFAHLSAEEKNSISHRGKALEKFRNYLTKK